VDQSKFNLDRHRTIVLYKTTIYSSYFPIALCAAVFLLPSWCINTALKYANSTKRAILDADYGRKDSETEAQVKEDFRQLRLNEHYEEYEDKVYNRINAL